MRLSPLVQKHTFKAPLDFKKFDGEATNARVIREESKNRPRDIKDILEKIDPRLELR